MDGRETKQHRVYNPNDGIDETGHLVVALEHLHGNPAAYQQSACNREEYRRPDEEHSP